MSEARSGVYSYDEVPYESWPYSQSHPDRLATMAAIFGMRPQPIDRARVLELGCASGGNLIPMAEMLPGSQFVGIELSTRQLEDGRRLADRLGLENLELLHRNILEVGEDLGKFHYIIAHGVYSWVPENVQEKMLEICSRNLEANGVAYVSYNTYPGWHMRGMLRDMMCYHTQRFREPRERAGHARALLRFLAEKVPTENNVYGAFLKQEVEEFARFQDHYLLHDHLEEVNEPVYFYQFMQRAERHGLQYLGEADLGVMLASNFPPDVESTLQRLAQDLVQMEQYMDFLRNRTFRQTLLCHAAQPLRRALDPKNVAELHLASRLKPAPPDKSVQAAEGWDFRGPRMGLRTRDPLLAAALGHLSKVWPQWLPFPELLAAVRAQVRREPVQDAARAAQDAQHLGRELLQCYAKGAVELHSHAPAFVPAASDCPAAAPLARLQAESRPLVTSRRHERVELNDLGRHVVRFLDGSRPREALLENLLQLVDQGVLVVHDDGKPAADRERARALLDSALQETLHRFADSALLVQ